jgi:hypothetical protein
MNQTFLPMPLGPDRDVEGREGVADLGVVVLDGLDVGEAVAVSLGLGVKVEEGVPVAVGTSVAGTAEGGGGGAGVGVGELHATSERRTMARKGSGAANSRDEWRRMDFVAQL